MSLADVDDLSEAIEALRVERDGYRDCLLDVLAAVALGATPDDITERVSKALQPRGGSAR